MRAHGSSFQLCTLMAAVMAGHPRTRDIAWHSKSAAAAEAEAAAEAAAAVVELTPLLNLPHLTRRLAINGGVVDIGVLAEL